MPEAVESCAFHRRSRAAPRSGAFPSIIALLIAAFPAGHAAAVDAPPRPRSIRILIASQTEGVDVRSDGTMTIRACDGTILGEHPAGERATITATRSSGLLINGVPWNETCFLAQPAGERFLSLDLRLREGGATEGDFPGALRFSTAPPTPDRIGVVNEVDLEDYVAAVVAREVWPTFEREAIRAQAIVTRTYALYHMDRRQGAGFDLSSTAGAQVYRGLRRDELGQAAEAATRETRGVVCTYRENGEPRLFPAYYSAACGGCSQSAAMFGPDDDVPPLAGGIRCDDCRIAPGDVYRWGPVRLSLTEAYQRLTARSPGTTSLGALIDVETTERLPNGRPVRLRLRGLRGAKQEMLAENFRWAIGSTVMKSTDCRIRVVKDDLILDQGRGYGHGLGLCQWGAQGQALQGKKATDILRYYYPGIELTRAY
jgi:stage II sporulation protein D